MKKLLSVVVVFVMLVAMSVSAFAADPVAPSTTYDEVSEKWVTSGTNEAYANKMMTVVAIEGSTISVDSIQYIDQVTADENGFYSFAGYLPKEDPEGDEEYKVFIGGEAIATPILTTGTIYAIVEENNDVTVTGTVIKLGDVTPATITLAGDTTVTATADPKTGAFSITAPAGTYTLTISKPGHTKYIHNNVNIAELAAAPEATYQLYAGDVTGEGYIGVADIGVVVGNLKKTPSETETTDDDVDVTDDDYVGVADIGVVVGNLKKENIVLPEA